jgi:hypothetical protein
MAVPIEKVLRQFWLPGITSITGKPTRGLQAFLLDDRYRLFKLATPSEFEVTPFDSHEIKNAICHDLSRMACASFESMYSMEPPAELDKSCGWGIIRSYYAAFFAAHSIIRIFGTTCTQLDTAHVQYISTVGSYTHPQLVKHSSGIYRTQWDEGNGVLRFSKPTESSHEATWKIFLDTLIGIRNSLLGGSAAGLITDLQNSALEIDALRNELCSGGFNFGNWLSSMRNRINYRHDFDTWFPYGRPAKHYRAIWSGANDRWLRDPMPIKSMPLQGREVEKMMELTGVIVALCRCLIEHIGETCFKKDSFVKFGPQSFIDFSKR